MQNSLGIIKECLYDKEKDIRVTKHIPKMLLVSCVVILWKVIDYFKEANTLSHTY